MKKVFVQKGPAKRRGVSVFGKQFLKNDQIIHISSNRRTGEVFTFTTAELARFAKLRIAPLLPRKARNGR